MARGACVVGGACLAGGCVALGDLCGWGRAWYARPPAYHEIRSVNARGVRILLECILVLP